ncbi:MAG: MIP/aquaporin family protein [Nanoarchaeota archaeon]
MASKFKRYIAEFIGTFALVFAGAGSVVVNAQTGALGNTGIAFVFGFVIAAMIYAIGHISGAHINPAVTIAFWLGRKFDKKDVLPYISSQILGAIFASLLILFVLGGDAFVGATLPRDGNFMQSFYLEIVLTFFLMFVIVGSTSSNYPQFAGLAIGLTVGLDALFGGPISGASMNPARSFGPALISGNFSYHWVYWAAPILGAALAVLAYNVIKPNNPKK